MESDIAPLVWPAPALSSPTVEEYLPSLSGMSNTITDVGCANCGLPTPAVSFPDGTTRTLGARFGTAADRLGRADLVLRQTRPFSELLRMLIAASIHLEGHYGFCGKRNSENAVP